MSGRALQGASVKVTLVPSRVPAQILMTASIDENINQPANKQRKKATCKRQVTPICHALRHLPITAGPPAPAASSHQRLVQLADTRNKLCQPQSAPKKAVATECVCELHCKSQPSQPNGAIQYWHSSALKEEPAKY
jgi:hypothetical protein